MKNMYKLVQAIIFAVLLITQNNVFAQNCCLDCQSDVKVVTNNKVLLEKINLKEGTSTTLNTNLYLSYRSGNAQKFWANVAIATAGVAVSTQLNNGNSAEARTASSISPIVPLGVSVATLPSIWKNRPRGVPNAIIQIQHKSVEGNVLKTWIQAISRAARNDAELLNIALNEPLTNGTVEISLVNDSKNSVYYWGYEGIRQVIENQKSIFNMPNIATLPTTNDTKISLQRTNPKGVFALSYVLPKKEDDIHSLLRGPKTPVWISEDGGCPSGQHRGSDGNCQPSTPELPEVVVIATPPPSPPPPPIHSNPWDNGGNTGGSENPNGGYESPGGGGYGGNNGNEDRPENIEKPFQTPLHPNSSKSELQDIPANFTWHMLGKGTRPNSRCNFMFTSVDFIELSVSQGQGGIFDGLYNWSATRNNHATNYSSDKQSAFVDIAYNVKRTPTFTVILYGPAPVSDDFTTFAVYILN